MHRTTPLAASLAAIVASYVAVHTARAEVRFGPPGRAELTLELDRLSAYHTEYVGRLASGWVATFAGVDSGFQVDVFDPADHDGTVRSITFPDQLRLGGTTWDHAAFLFVAGGAGLARVYTVTTADIEATPVFGILDAGPLAASFDAADSALIDGAPNLGQPGTNVLGGPDGRLCLAYPAGVVCLDPRPGASPRALDLVATADLDAVVAPSDRWAAPAIVDGRPPVAETWLVQASTPDDAGATWLLASKGWIGAATSPGVSPSTSVAVVLKARPGAAPEVVFGPVPVGRSQTGADDLVWSPLGRALAWDPQLGAVVALAEGWDVGWHEPSALGATATGVGLRVFGPDGESGYVSFSHALAVVQPQLEELLGAFFTPAVTALATGPDGLEVTVLWQSTHAPTIPEQTFLLTLDPATLDLDSDGLDAATEAALGTSDWRADSDGGVNADAVEARLDQSDPTDFRDDAWSYREDPPGITWMIESPLVRWALPEAAGSPSQTYWDTTDVGTDAPFCLYGTCWAPGGRVVARYPDDDRTGGVTAADGRAIAVWGAAGVSRTWFEDGRTELWLPAAALATVGLGVPGPRFLPIDADRAFFVDVGRVIACHGAGATASCAVVFDLAEARAASGLTAAPTEQRRLLGWYDVWVEQGLRQVGWDAVHERVQGYVSGTFDGWLVSVDDLGDAQILERSHAWLGANRGGAFDGWDWQPRPFWVLHDLVVPVGGGDHDTIHGLVTASRTYLSTGEATHLPFLPPKTVWGDTVVAATRESGVVAFVRSPRRVDPGDVLTLRLEDLDAVTPDGEALGWMLFRSGPQGGIAPLWDAPRLDLGDVAGIDVDAAGDLCVADRGKGHLLLFEPSDPRSRVPDLGVATEPVPGILGCLEEPEGVVVLVDHAPWLYRWTQDAGLVAADDTGLTVPASPLGLARDGSGAPYVVAAEAGLRGSFTTRDGRVVSMREGSLELLVDGRPLTRLDHLAGSPDHVLDVSYSGTELHGRLRAVERPDGKLVVSLTEATADGRESTWTLMWVVDLDVEHVGTAAGADTRALPLALEDFPGEAGAGLVVVPGAPPTGDPWTGAGGGSGPDGPGGAIAPTPPTADAGPIAVPPGLASRGGDGGGCQGGPTTPLPIALALAAIAALAPLRRRHRPR